MKSNIEQARQLLQKYTEELCLYIELKQLQAKQQFVIDFVKGKPNQIPLPEASDYKEEWFTWKALH